jgi:hypothetical protein
MLESETIWLILKGLSNEVNILASLTGTKSCLSNALRLLEELLRVLVGLNVCCCYISICSCFVSVVNAWTYVLTIDAVNESRFLFL